MENHRYSIFKTISAIRYKLGSLECRIYEYKPCRSTYYSAYILHLLIQGENIQYLQLLSLSR
jgi:hypothetical protein